MNINKTGLAITRRDYIINRALYTLNNFYSPSASALARRATAVSLYNGENFIYGNLVHAIGSDENHLYQGEVHPSRIAWQLLPKGVDVIEGRIPFQIRLDRWRFVDLLDPRTGILVPKNDRNNSKIDEIEQELIEYQRHKGRGFYEIYEKYLPRVKQ